MVQGKKQNRKNKRKVQKNRAFQQEEAKLDKLVIEMIKEIASERKPVYDDNKALEFDRKNLPGLSPYDFAQINKVRPVKISSAGVLVFNFKGFPELEMQLSCIYCVVHEGRPHMKGEAHTTIVSKIYDGNGYRMSMRLATSEYTKCDKLGGGCSVEMFKGKGDETAEQSYLQVMKICPHHLLPRLEESGLSLPTRFTSPTALTEPITNEYSKEDVRHTLVFPYCPADTLEEEMTRPRPVKIASVGDIVYDYKEDTYTTVSSPGALLFHREGFPAIEMHLSCIYAIGITHPSPPCIKALEGKEKATFYWLFDGNGHGLDIEIGHDARDEILRCKTHQYRKDGCSFDVIKCTVESEVTKTHLEVIKLCPTHLDMPDLLPKEFVFAGLKRPSANVSANVASDKAVDELTAQFLRALEDVE